MVCTEGVGVSACGVGVVAAGLSEIGVDAGVCDAGTSIGVSGVGVADTIACGYNVAFRTATVQTIAIKPHPIAGRIRFRATVFQKADQKVGSWINDTACFCSNTN